jgi:hypothetical protein
MFRRARQEFGALDIFVANARGARHLNCPLPHRSSNRGQLTIGEEVAPQRTGSGRRA